MNQWKNWLREHYQYNFSQIKWSRLIPEKWRNALHKHHIAKKEIVSKRHSYEKDPLIDSNKQFEVYSLSNPKENFQKYYRYDLLSYKFLDYEKKTECFFYRSPFQGNKNQGVSYTSKEALLDMPRNIPINNYLNNNLGRVDTLYMKKVADRKYFDWMGMNEKILKQPISNLESWFFPEFVLLSNVYKIQPWFIPSKLLLLNLNRNENQTCSENQKINEKGKRNSLIASKKKYRNQKEKEPISRGDLGSVLSQPKDIEENYVRSGIKKGKKQYKNKTEAELDFFLKRYLLFQLRWGDTLNQRMINNIKN
ncbi:hypothetical protein CASFOL_009510 [Castilleja foliolosa]|uniref:Ycf1 n=1 Tax=Castilleja foliolosa TaxID=1961234 RepID=A0ABD3DWC4_9LAMI